MTFSLIDILYLPMLLFIGVITSWEDFRMGKIRNKWVKLGFFYGLFILIIMIIWTLFGDYLLNNFSLIKYLSAFDSEQLVFIPLDYFYKFVLNSGVAITVGFFLWRFGLMAAGDAKLFFIFSWLLPFKYYWQSFFPLFPSLVLLINIYIPLLFVLFFLAAKEQVKQVISYLSNSKKKDKKLFYKLKEIIEKLTKQIVGFSAILILVVYLREKVSPWLPDLLNSNSFLFLFFFVFRRLVLLMIKKRNLVVLLVSLVIIWQLIRIYRIGFYAVSVELKTVLELAIIYVVSISILQAILENYINQRTTKKISINNLEPGMRPKLIKKPIPQIGSIRGGGISIGQVKELETWGRQNRFREIEIYKKFPFAFWLFMGVILTILIKGSIISIVINHFFS